MTAKLVGGYMKRISAATSRLLVLLVVISSSPFTQNHAQDGRTVQLLAAAGNGETGNVRRLLDEGLNVNVRDEFGFTALMFAARSGSAPTVNLLLSRGADPNVRSKLM